MGKKDRDYLIDAYNATLTESIKGTKGSFNEIESYEEWLESQLLSRINAIVDISFAKWLNFNYQLVPKQLEFYVPQTIKVYTFGSDYHYNKVIKEHGKTIEQLYNTYKQLNMGKIYKEIEFEFGDLQDAVDELFKYKSRGELVLISFNEVKLYSDVDDVDSAYKKVVGMTKLDFDIQQQNSINEHKEQERKHKAAISELTKEWIEKGNAILDQEYHELWFKCVPVRLRDLYQGMELGNCLDIVKALNSNCSLNTAKGIISDQGHSGMSFGLVCSMVNSFCKRGSEFVDFVK